MKVTKDKTENCQAHLTIEMEPAELEESLDAAYKKLVKKARVPGFRKGKAPRDLLERYLGRDALLEEAINDLIPKAYDDAIKEQELDAVAQPEIELSQMEPVIFKAIVPLRPNVKVGDYSGIQVTRNVDKITEKNIDEVVDHLRHQYATWEPADRPVAYDDMVIFNVESTLEDKPFIVQQGAQYQVIKGQQFPAPGFPDQIIGIKSGEQKEFKLNLPEDYQQEEYRGKEVSFKIELTEIKQEVLPEVTDEFAKEVNPEFESVKKMRESIESDMKARAEERARIDFEEKVIDAVVGVSEVEFPPIMVESEVNRTINQSFQGNSQGLEQYLANMNKTIDELKDELRPSATLQVTRSLVLGQVSEDSKIEVTPEEIDAEIDSMTINSTPERKKELVDVLNNADMRHSIEHTLIARKTMKLLTEIAESNKPAKKTQAKTKKAADADKEEK